jgi:hypothetical protein
VAAPVIDRRFPDVTRLLVTALEVWVDGDTDRTGPETPTDLQSRLPFIRAYRIGGGRDRLNDSPAVAVDVFAGSYSVAEALAEDVAQWLCGPPPPIALFDRVEPDVAPRRLPWGDERIFRFQAQYTVVTRRVPRV